MYYWYILFAVPPLVLGLAAQAWVKRAFAEGSKVAASSGLTGAQVSRQMLDSGGLQNVTVEGIAGQLSDHYDPRDKEQWRCGTRSQECKGERSLSRCLTLGPDD